MMEEIEVQPVEMYGTIQSSPGLNWWNHRSLAIDITGSSAFSRLKIIAKNCALKPATTKTDVVFGEQKRNSEKAKQERGPPQKRPVKSQDTIKRVSFMNLTKPGIICWVMFHWLPWFRQLPCCTMQLLESCNFLTYRFLLDCGTGTFLNYGKYIDGKLWL